MYVGSPLKQLLNARDNFLPYGIIAFISNVLKLVFAVIVYKCNFLSVRSVAYILIATAVVEVISLLIYIQVKSPLKFRIRKQAYLKLIKEAFPQYMAGLFDSSLSRMDWILLGILSTNAVTASYSFAYRAFEVAKLPLTIIAPIIMVKLARMAQQGGRPDKAKGELINQMLHAELFLSVFIFLMLNILWGPVVTQLTHGKYGDSNASQFLFLSACLPLQFFINLLWTLTFTHKQYKKILYVIAVSAVLNVLLNLLVIEKLGGLGAAIAYFATNIVQAVIYYLIVKKHILTISIMPLLVLPCIAVGAYFCATFISKAVVIEFALAGAIYVIASLFTKQITWKQLSSIKAYASR
jgi:O-antigen/teichoic acid export membrane protein